MATSDYDKARLEDHQVIKISGIGQPEVGHFGDQSSGKFVKFLLAGASLLESPRVHRTQK
ncbi:hypothetical protein C0J52_11795 [Blattella germanica]|nr:hypothetical protein C0J52_11795 [Blattella germanica]